MRVILVPVAGRPESAIALDCAFELAGQMNSDVVACHVRPHRNMSSQSKTASELVLHFDDDALQKGATKKNVESTRNAAHKLFDQRARAHDFPLRKKPSTHSSGIAIWEEFVGSPGRAMSIVGPISDMLMLTRPRSSKSEKARAFLLAAVLHSARPVMVLGAKKQKVPGKRIAIAWNQSNEASLAVKAAMPMLRVAESVTIISRGTEDRVGPKSSHLARYLAHWGIDARIDQSKQEVTPQRLETACDKAKADLLVMGAYSRGRLRERLFGGITEHMLLNSKRAVLVLHT